MPDTPIAAADITVPVPGLYKMKLVKNGPLVPVKVSVTGERDPETGDLIEDEIVTVEVNGIEVKPERIDWMVERVNLGGELIDQAEHDYLIADAEWAMEYAPSEPRANPGQAIDLSKAPPIF